MCMSLELDEQGCPIWAELKPTLMWKYFDYGGGVVGDCTEKLINPYRTSISCITRTKHRSCLDGGKVMQGKPSFGYIYAVMGDHPCTLSGNHVFESRNGCASYLKSGYVIPVIVWGRAVKFKFKNHIGYAVEFITAASESIELSK